MAGELPEALAGIVADERVTVRRDGEPGKDGKCVVYWLQRAQRALDNPALEVAIACGNALGLPVVAYFLGDSELSECELEALLLFAAGLTDLGLEMAERGVGFVVRRPTDGDTLEAFLDEVGAAMVVGDENVCREPERWRRVLRGSCGFRF